MGDFAHNVRSALDHTIYAFCRLKQKPGILQFTIYSTERDFVRQSPSRNSRWRYPRPMPDASDPLNYTEAEWQQITDGGRPLRVLSANQGMTLHRHWMWANAARDWFDQKLPERDNTAAVETQLADEASAAMYVWYGLLWSVIEGTRARKIKLGAPMSTDIRQIGEALRDARNAAFHVGPTDQNWDMRLFEILRDSESPMVIRRVNRGFGRLFYEEARARGQEAEKQDGR